MYHIIISMVSIFSLFDLKFAECAVVYQCYKIYYSRWVGPTTDADVTNIWCEHYCKDAGANYQYSGTISNRCYCRADKPTWIDDTQRYSCKDHFECPGNIELCGGRDTFFMIPVELITVSKIERITDAVSIQNTQASTTMSVSMRDSTTADYMHMLNSDTSGAIVTHRSSHTVRDITGSTSAESAVSTVVNETPSVERTDQIQYSLIHCTTVFSKTFMSLLSIESNTFGFFMKHVFCMTVQNTQATSATSVSIRDTTTADIIKRLTSDTYPAIVTYSTPNTSREISSSSSENASFAISIVMTETTTREITVKRPKKLLCECPKIVCNTKWHFLDGSDKTDSEVRKLALEGFYQDILSKITIDKKSVTKEKRKRNSAINKTRSAKFIGTGCIVFLILPMAMVIAIDLLNCCLHFRMRSCRRKHGKRTRMNAISGDSDMTLQENIPSTEDYYGSRCGNNFHPDEMKRETYHRRRVDPY